MDFIRPTKAPWHLHTPSWISISSPSEPSESLSVHQTILSVRIRIQYDDDHHHQRRSNRYPFSQGDIFHILFAHGNSIINFSNFFTSCSSDHWKSSSTSTWQHRVLKLLFGFLAFSFTVSFKLWLQIRSTRNESFAKPPGSLDSWSLRFLLPLTLIVRNLT